MYKQILDPVGDSLGLSSIFAALPLVALFVLLGVLRLKAWIAALLSLAVALVVAIAVYSMPVGQALLAGSEGAAFGFFPIMWIVLNAIWLYNMTVVTGHFDVLRRSFAKVSDDQRVQAVIIAFCFGALLEALAGFGTPVAITSVMLIALGFRPIKAAAVALVANTAPVAFGAIAVPITTLATVTGLPQDDLGAMVGRQTPVLAVFVPLALVFIVDRKNGLRQTWLAAVVCGGSFAVAQFVTSNYMSIELTDIVASLVGMGATVLLLRVWSPSVRYLETDEPELAGVTSGRGAAGTRSAGSGSAAATGADGADVAVDDADVVDSRADVARAYSPYLILIAVLLVSQIPAVKDALDSVTKLFNWPGLHIKSANGEDSTIAAFKFNWLGATGTLVLFSGLLTIPAIGISLAKAAKAYADSYRQLATAVLTVMAVLALAYVMNASGQTATLGNWMAGAGAAFAVLSPILGWLGVAVTGSDTSSNSLFGALQVTAAHKAGLDPVLMAAANSSGGVLGKMISPQNLAIAAAAVGMAGQEGDLFRKVIGWSLVFIVGMSVLVYLQSTAVLGWMVP
ncbi:MAG: lactate permease [Actinomycetota bacterium]|jgi:lactate permease|nr:lactate permease [Actinomycetota bacterium]